MLKLFPVAFPVHRRNSLFKVDPTNRPNYYRYLARLNFEAAEGADYKIGHLPGYDMAAPPPVMNLCAHAIELSMKAYLLDKGVPENQVRKLNHNLMKAWEKCKAVSVCELPEINEDLLAIISDLLKSGRLRYGDESKLGRVPVYGPLQNLCGQFLDLCGAPSYVDLLPDT